MAVEIAVLGPLAVSVDGRDATPTAPKARMLLALLALRAGQIVAGGQLIEDVWPELDGARGRRVLQVRIAGLRKLLSDAGVPGFIGTHGAGYVLGAESATLDATRFEDAVTDAAIRAADGDHEAAAAVLRAGLGLWRGEALVDVDSCLTLEAEAVRYRELRLGALESRIAADLACGRHQSVTAELEGLVATHPYRETLWELDALALYRCGRQADALRACALARATLRDDLGLDPGPALRSLEESILAQRSDLDAPTPHRITSGVPALLEQARTPALVARQSELLTLTQLSTATRETREPRLAIVQGEAGIGKTRLVAEFAAARATEGAFVLAGRCDEDPLANYQPFREAFRSVRTGLLEVALRSLAPVDRAELGRLEPSLAAGRVAEDDGDRYQLFEAVAALLGRLGEAAPVVFVLEDVHWADRSTLRLLSHLVNHPACGGVLLVATSRPEGVSLPSADLLRRPERVHQFTLHGLDADEIDRLVSALLDATIEPGVGSAVHRASGGNPLFAREIVRHVRESGAVSIARVLALPPELEAIILKRTERLAPDTAQLVTTAAVLGQSFPLELLSAVVERDPLDVIDLLEPALRAGLLVETGLDNFAFGHAVVRDALHHSVLESRRARLHADAASYLERSRPEHLAEAAEHLREAGAHIDPEHLSAVFAGAAEQAFRAVAYDEAAEFFELAVDAAARAGHSPALQARLHLRRAVAREAAGDPDGKSAIRTAALAASEAGEPELFAEGALAYARMPLVVTSADPTTIDLLERALEQLDGKPVAARALVASRLAYELLWDPGEQRGRLAREAVDLARALGDAATLAAVLADRRYDGGWSNLEQWLSESRDILRLATVAGDRELTWHGGYCCVNSLVLLGRFDEAAAELALLTEVAAELRRPRMQWWTTMAAASLRIDRGDFVEGERLVFEASALGERTGDLDATAVLLEQVYTLSWLRGRLDEVCEAVGQYADATPSSSIARIAQAHALAHCGRVDESRAAMAQFATNGFADLPMNVSWYANVALLADAVARLGDAEAAAALVPLLSPHRDLTIDVGASSAFLGPMARYLGQALATAGRLDEAVNALDEAIERSRSSGSVPWTVLASHDLVQTLRRRNAAGDCARADELASIVSAQARRLGMGDLARRCQPTGDLDRPVR